MERWIMSGLEKIHRDRSLAKRRTSAGLSPSYGVDATSMSPGTAEVSDAAARSWSCPSALVGARYRARDRGFALSAVNIGSWYASDLPEAVPVLSTTWRPSRAR